MLTLFSHRNASALMFEYLNALLSPLTPFWGGARVLELGSGMSGLAGMGVAACSNAAEVVITDGNPDAVKSLKVHSHRSNCFFSQARAHSGSSSGSYDGAFVLDVENVQRGRQ